MFFLMVCRICIGRYRYITICKLMIHLNLINVLGRTSDLRVVNKSARDSSDFISLQESESEFEV
jgi:hypothetical protein